MKEIAGPIYAITEVARSLVLLESKDRLKTNGHADQQRDPLSFVSQASYWKIKSVNFEISEL
jgi:hypothetical protein